MRSMTIDDVVRIARIYGVRVSPRGEVGYIVARPDLEANKYRSYLTIWRPSGDEYYLEAESISSIAWSPTGSSIAFLGRKTREDRKEGVGLYIWTGKGEPRLLTWLKHGASQLSWPQEDRILVLAYTEVEGDYDKDGDYVATSSIPLWRDGEGLVAGLKRVILSIDPGSGYTAEVAAEGTDILGYEYHKGSLYYYHAPDPRDPLSHRLVKLEAGRREEVLEGYTIGQLSSSDEKLYMLAHTRPIGISSHYRLYTLEDGEASCASCGFKWNIASIAGFRDGEPVIVYLQRGASILAQISGAEARPITGEREYVHAAHVHKGIAAYILSTPTTPPEVYADMAGSRARVSRVNQWLAREVALVEPIHFTVEAEGDMVDAWVMLPPSGEPPYPAILYIHGGPKGMYGYRFHPEMQLAASRGYAVVYSNPRGSDGYSEEFADVRGRYGEEDYRQLMKVLDVALERFSLDPERLGVTGISYGGYMTNWIITRTSRFKAAVSENGIADWISDYWASDIGYWFDPDQIGGTPQTSLEAYISRSPAFHVDNVETPLLLIHSMEDYRCFIDQALAMHVSLRVRGKKSRLIVFKKGGHGHSILGEPRHRRKRLEAIWSWFDEHLRGAINGGRQGGGDPSTSPKPAGKP